MTSDKRNKRRAKISKAALRKLESLAVSDILPAVEGSYVRSEFGSGWDDIDSDGQNERAEVLIDFHRKKGGELTFATSRERRVTNGSWLCRFTGEIFTDAGDLDIDHLVPLKNAWLSGASAWTRERRERYANGVGIKSNKRSWLLPVSSSANRSKGAKSPDQWMPTRVQYHVNYAASWIRTKEYWKLSITPAEKQKLTEILTGKKPRMTRVPKPATTSTTREDRIIDAIKTFTGRRTVKGYPYVTELRRHAGIPDITTEERDRYSKVVLG